MKRLFIHLKRHPKTTCVVIGLLLAGIFLWRSNFPEVRHNDIPISRWMARYHFHLEPLGALPAGSLEDSIKAFRAMGPGAVEYLINLAGLPDEHPEFQRVRRHIVTEAGHSVKRRLGDFLEQKFMQKQPQWKDWAIRDSARSALENLGTDARVLLPLMSRHIQSTNAHERAWALRVLSQAGENRDEAVPVINRLLKDDSVRDVLSLDLGPNP